MPDMKTLTIDGVTFDIVDAKAVSPIVLDASGEVIAVNDASNRPLQGLTLYGKTEQFTTTGKNLYDESLLLNAANWTVDGGVYSGRNDKLRTLWFSNQPVTFAPNTQYFISFFGSTENTACNNRIGVYYTDGTFSEVYFNHTELQYHELTTTVGKSVEEIVMNYGSVTNISFSKFMICVASSDNEYEPYTGGIPSPNPDYPQELKSAGDSGSVVVKVTGKNLWSLQSSVTTAEITSGHFKLSDLPKGVPLTASADITKYPDDTATNTRMNFTAKYTDGSRTDGESSFDTTGAERDGVARKKSATITIDANKTVSSIELRVMDYSNQNGRNAKAENIQIEIGTVATEYEPYKEPVIATIPTPGGLSGVADSYDEIDFTKGICTKRVQTLVLTGAEEWAISITDGHSHFLLSMSPELSKDSSVLWCRCNYYSGMSWDDLYRIRGSEDTVGMAASTGLRVVDNKNFPTYDTTAFKQFLADKYAEGNPVIVQYVPVEPITTELTAEQLEAYANLHTHKTYTRIENDCGADMKVSYAADTKAYIDNKFNELAAAIINNA